jgi:hypothetical protein
MVKLGQTLAQNPSQPIDLPCFPRTFVAFPNVKVVQFLEALNFHVQWHCQFEAQMGETLRSTLKATVLGCQENPQVVQQFMLNLLTKTYISLCKSCRGMLDLQLCYSSCVAGWLRKLEKVVLKKAKPNSYHGVRAPRARRHAASARRRTHAHPCWYPTATTGQRRGVVGTLCLRGMTRAWP